MNDWYRPLFDIRSKGSQADRPGSLAGLAQARRITQGQFFTPLNVAKLIWRIVEPAMTAYAQQFPGDISILDNSVGTGSLLRFADPQRHALYGIDIDADAVLALGKAAEQAGFKCAFLTEGMEWAKVRHCHVALINPPFSLNLTSPAMIAYPCCSHGIYGPNSSAVSHAYALAQALDAAQLVVALLPATFARDVVENPAACMWNIKERLVAHIELPAGAFREECTEVATSLLVFGSYNYPAQPPVMLKLSRLDADLPVLPLTLAREYQTPVLRAIGVDDDGPAISRPVTGNNDVRVAHDGRRIILGFACGLTEAKVMNAILQHRIREKAPEKHRLPKGYKYTGQGALDIEVHWAQEDPRQSIRGFLDTIQVAGGKVVLAADFMPYFDAGLKRSMRQAMPLRKTVWMPDGVAAGDVMDIQGIARRTQVADASIWGSPVIQAGQEVRFQRLPEGDYSYEIKGKTFRITAESLYRAFEVMEGAAEPGWQLVHPGLHVAYPELSKLYEARARALGLDSWLTWTFQWRDAVELAMKPRGAVVCWLMGLGKARLAAALILLIGCRHGLVVTEAGLIDEMVSELKSSPIPPENWQVITRPEQLDALKQVNLIAYERLRVKIKGRKTYASCLRRRIGVLVSDEGAVLSNPTSDQARALMTISAKRRYLLSGTLAANYVHESLPMVALTCGDGTAAQPWGYHRGHVESNWRKTVAFAERGIDAFRNHFVDVTWCTREWEEDNISGAKRIVPRIKNIQDYRSFLAGHVLRRVDKEPEVAAFVRIPEPSREIVELPWDKPHLSYYLQVAEDFASWYMSLGREEGRKNNLIAILARLRAVSVASDFPQYGVDGFGAYAPLTSKQRWLLEELTRLNDSDDKAVVYFHSPKQVDMFHKLLLDRNINSVRFHGGLPPKQRMSILNARFRHGPDKICLATYGVTARGLNLYCSSECILANRDWSATVEEQSIRRLLRPQQTKPVRARMLHHPGGIDVYKDQLTRWKRNAEAAGLDWATPETDGEEFQHLDSLLTHFCQDLAEMLKVDRWNLRTILKEPSHA